MKEEELREQNKRKKRTMNKQESGGTKRKEGRMKLFLLCCYHTVCLCMCVCVRVGVWLAQGSIPLCDKSLGCSASKTHSHFLPF